MATRKTLCRACLSLFLVLAVFTANGNAQTKLEYKFKKGETLNYLMEQNNNLSMNVQGMELNIVMKQQMNMTWKIKEVAKDGVATVGQTIKRVRFSVDSPQGKTEFDSESGEKAKGPLAGAIGPQMKALVNSEFTVKINPQGKILDTEIPAEIVKAMQSGGQGSLSAQQLKQLTAQGSLNLPVEEIKKGDNWKHESKTKMPFGTMNVSQKYTLEEPESPDIQKITVDPNLTLQATNKDFQAKLKSSKGNGVVLFNTKIGQVQSMEMNQTLVMEVDAGGQSILQTIVTKTSMTLEK